MKRRVHLIAFIFFCLVLTSCEPKTSSDIKIGGMWDLTGPTSEVATPYSDGERDYIAYLNAQGGVNGQRIDLIYEDYAYNIPQAEAVYSRLVNEQKVVAILGWGTGDTLVLRSKVAADKIPFFSCSYDEDLTNIKSAPYNFLIGVTYSGQMRIALRYIKDHWTDKSRKPRVAFFYNETPFGLSPIKAGKEYAAANGIDIVAEKIVNLSALDATAQLKAVIDAGGADYGIINETSGATVTIVRGAKKMNMPIQFISLNWGVDETVLMMLGQDGEGLMGTTPFVFPYENVPGLLEMRSALKMIGKDDRKINLRYVQGWATAKVLVAGIAKAGKNPTGESIRRGLESLGVYNTGGITAPIQFTGEKHKGAMALKMYQIKNGRWEPITDYMRSTP